MNSIKLENRMDTIFITSENSKPYEPYRLFPSLTNNITLQRIDKYVALIHTKATNLKCQQQPRTNI